jgi:hypothetical protein
LGTDSGSSSGISSSRFGAMNPVSGLEWEPEWKVEEARDGVMVRRLKPMPEEVRKAEIEKERRARWYSELESMKGLKIFMFYPNAGKREFRITRAEALRAIEASVIQILKEKLDYRLEEILAPDKCDTSVHLAEDDREILTKCVGHAFGLHLHINFVIKEGQEGGSLVATVMTVEVGE